MAIEVTRWLATDGELFDTPEEADRYDGRKAILAKLGNGQLYLGAASSEEILNWIETNFELLKEYFGA